MSAPFTTTLPSGLVVKCSPFKMKFLEEWGVHRQSMLIDQLKKHIDLIPEHLRARAVLNSTSGTMLDSYDTFLNSTEGQTFFLQLALKDAGSEVDLSDLPWDDHGVLWRESAGRGGLINPLSEEESKRWNRKLPPKSPTDGGSEPQK